MGRRAGRFRGSVIGAVILILFCVQPSAAAGRPERNLLPVCPSYFRIEPSYVFLVVEDVPAADNRDYRFRDKYNRWRDLSPEEKKQLRDRMDRLKGMPPVQKERYRERSQQWERLPAEDKNRIRQSIRRWNELTPEERRNIRRQLDER